MLAVSGGFHPATRRENTMRYFRHTWADGSVALDVTPISTAPDIVEMTEEEAREFYRTAEIIDVIESSIADKFEREEQRP